MQADGATMKHRTTGIITLMTCRSWILPRRLGTRMVGSLIISSRAEQLAGGVVAKNSGIFKAVEDCYRATPL